MRRAQKSWRSSMEVQRSAPAWSPRLTAFCTCRSVRKTVASILIVLVSCFMAMFPHWDRRAPSVML
jgi:hypothetical protein